MGIHKCMKLEIRMLLHFGFSQSIVRVPLLPTQANLLGANSYHVTHMHLIH